MEFTLRWTAQSPDLIGIRWSHRCFSGPGSCFGACPPNNASHQSLNKVICNSDSEIDLRFSKIFLLLDSWRAFRNLLHCRIEAPLSHRLFQTDGGDNYLPVVSNQYGCVCVCVCVCVHESLLKRSVLIWRLHSSPDCTALFCLWLNPRRWICFNYTGKIIYPHSASFPSCGEGGMFTIYHLT